MFVDRYTPLINTADAGGLKVVCLAQHLESEWEAALTTLLFHEAMKGVHPTFPRRVLMRLRADVETPAEDIPVRPK